MQALRGAATSGRPPVPVLPHEGRQHHMRNGSRGMLKVDAATSRRLSRVPHQDTSAELVVRSLLHRLGLRFRVDNRDLPGSPDVANRSGRWALFVNGCFWHAHRGCKRATIPERNREFWLAKFRGNHARDKAALLALRRLGYRTIVVWECELRHPATLRRRLERSVSSARLGARSSALERTTGV
jgi:DNA mismatch endonuclease (patch repair protein)